MKKGLSTILLILALLIGLSLLLYPSVSNYINSQHQTREIAQYVNKVETMTDEEYDAILAAAKEYNAQLIHRGGASPLSEKEKALYNSLLNVMAGGIMGYIEIRSIGVRLPIYHGTDETVLQRAVGHLEWSSLPVGGESTHCVLSGHRGLPSAQLFTNLPRMVEGDTFVIRVMNEVLTYQVHEISVIEPDDLSKLRIEEGKDLCTLVTCTPYGINTHRLLVQAHRISNNAESELIRVSTDGILIEPMIVAPFLAVPLYIIMIVFMIIQSRIKKNKLFKLEDDENEKEA